MTYFSGSISEYKLSDRYTLTKGRVFLTGTQALARIAMDQARRDRQAGLKTAGFISGYRGSPLGGFDKELWASRALLEENDIKFAPAINEDLGASAVLGAQQASLDPDCPYDGIFSMWYGKGPGVDRSGDALKHGNAYGSAPKGGVLVVAGDDHGCVSSSMPHQSDVAFMSWFMPVLSPASVSEYLEFGEYGFALSRFSGTWVGFKAISEIVESGQSFDLLKPREFVTPQFDTPSGGIHVRKLDLPSPEIETRMIHKLRAVDAFVHANPLDRAIFDSPSATFGIVTSGKAYNDVREALRLLDLSETDCRKIGIDIYKVGMVWPLAKSAALGFMEGKDELFVIEEKRGIIESQLKEYFYDWQGDKPQRILGKHDETLNTLLPWTGELSARLILKPLAERLDRNFPGRNFTARAQQILQQMPPVIALGGAKRTPYFCSGCPHNSSTKVPKGSKASSGIGCHVMASWMDRDTEGYAQMGGEGIPSAISDIFAGGKHRFQNLGDGTWHHSGSLAIRQAIGFQANVTYKILYNDAIAMTGGQSIDGTLSPASVAHVCRAEGVKDIALVSDDIGKFKRSDFPKEVGFYDRRDLDAVQRKMREIKGVSVLIYEQTCATEKRRRRKRGELETPDKTTLINDLVCEGCGDCSVESNCLSVEPVKTEFGTKRKINQSSCNKDFTCVNGFCPSFVTLTDAKPKRKARKDLEIEGALSTVPLPQLPVLTEPYNLLIAGIGGTGVVTLGSVVTMAAHLEGRGASVLDFTGFAQKFGTVLSYLRLAPRPDDLFQVRIEDASTDGLIGCDSVVATSPQATVYYGPKMRAVVNKAEMPTGDLVLNRDADLQTALRIKTLEKTLGADRVATEDVNQLSQYLFGDTVYANVILLGMAWQKGLVPVGLDALLQAFALNGVKVKENISAFHAGRCVAHDKMAFARQDGPPVLKSAQEIIDHRAEFLTAYQNKAFGDRYRKTLDQFITEMADRGSEDLLSAAAKSLFKLMAYKDEYEIARLHTDADFSDMLSEQFEPGFKRTYHLAPPLLSFKKDHRGRPRKRSFGPWIVLVFKTLARLRFMRGTRFDIFGWQRERKEERALIGWFEDVLRQIAILPVDQKLALQLISAPMEIRGYGPVKHESLITTKAYVDHHLKQLI